MPLSAPPASAMRPAVAVKRFHRGVGGTLPPRPHALRHGVEEVALGPLHGLLAHLHPRAEAPQQPLAHLRHPPVHPEDEPALEEHGHHRLSRAPGAPHHRARGHVRLVGGRHRHRRQVELGGRVIEHRRGHRGHHHVGDLDARAVQLQLQALRPAERRVLGRRVSGQQRRAAHGEHGLDIEHMAGALAPEVRQHRAREAHVPEAVHVEGALDVLPRQIIEVARRTAPPATFTSKSTRP